MFHKILMPLDLTKKHAVTLGTVVDLARQSGGEVHLLHVIEAIEGLPVETEREFFDSLEQAAKAHLEEVGEALREENVRFSRHVLIGKPVAETVRCAQEMDIDLIVMTSPHFDPENPSRGWASLSHKISFVSPCPVLLVK